MAGDPSEPQPAGDEHRSLTRVDRLGPAGGGCLSMIGALLVMIGFLLPWASCAGDTYNGIQLATSPVTADAPNRGVLLLIPCVSLGLLGIGLGLLPLSARERLRAGFFSLRAAGGVALGALALAGMCLACGFLVGVRQAQNTVDDLLGLGFNVIQIEIGFWVSLLGLIVALVGAAVATVTAFVKIPLKRK